MSEASQVTWREVRCLDANGVDTGKTELKPYHGDTEVAWMYQPGGQAAFLASPVFETLATGNRGGGKSACLIADFLQDCGKGYGVDYKGVIFRQTYPQLQDIVGLSKKLIPLIWPNAKFNEARLEWKFPGDEALMFRHISTPDDYWSYHGWSVPWLGFEELTTWADDKCYKAMFSICRSTNPNIPRRVRATTNPYGPGHGWVKARFHLPIPPNQRFGPIVKDVDADGHALPERLAIRVELTENKVLLHSDPFYLDRIRASARNESELAAWVHGSWDIVAGGMFDDIWRPPIHIIPDIFANQIPREWRLNRAYDHGQARPFSVGWYAQSNGEPIKVQGRTIGNVPGDIIRIMEWYGWCGTPNEGLRLTSREIAKGIIEREQEFGIYGRVKTGVADSAIFDDYEPGHSVAGDMAKLGINWFAIDKGPGSRVQGWQQMRTYLKAAIPPKGGVRENPGLFSCARCEHYQRTLPVLPRDTKKLDDVDTTSEDHLADEVRYRLRQKDVTVKKGHF